MALWHDPQAKGLPKLLLGHGNGLNSLCQIGLMRALRQHFDVYGVDFRGHGSTRLPLPLKPENPWEWYVSDLEALIERHFDGRVLYAGHSLSGVTGIRLALKRPELFKHLAPIDPAILPSTKARLYPLVRALGLTSRVNALYRGTLVRRNIWPDRAAAVDYFTGRKAFATWPPEAVEGYIDGGLVERDGNLTLACPREWEARTFKYVPTEVERRLRGLQCSTTLIRASQGSVYPKTLHLSPTTELKDVSGTHFAHLEQPSVVASVLIKAMA